MIARYGDVTDTHLLVQATTKFEAVIAKNRHQDLYHSTCASFEGKALKNDIIFSRLLYVNEGIFPSMRLENVGIDRVADFTAERLPEVGHTDLIPNLSHLCLQPALQASIVYEANTATAFASRQQWISH